MGYQVVGTQQQEKKMYNVISTQDGHLAADTLEYCKQHGEPTQWSFDIRGWIDPGLPSVDYTRFTADKPREWKEEQQ